MGNHSKCRQGNLLGHSCDSGDIVGGRSDCTKKVKYETMEACLGQESFERGRLTALSRRFGHGGLGASSRSFGRKEKQSE